MKILSTVFTVLEHFFLEGARQRERMANTLVYEARIEGLKDT